MTNREWLMEQMQNMSDEEFCDLIQDCNLKEYGVVYDTSYGKCMCKWLDAEHKEKPKLAEAERVILENVDKKYKWIVKCANGDLMLCAHAKPTKFDTMWLHNGGKNIDIFNHLFQFIKWEDENPYNIEELLK